MKIYGNITGILDFDFNKKKNKLALIDIQGESYTYSQLKSEVEKVSRLLSGLGVKNRDLCAIFGENSSKWIILDLAIQNIGAVCVPIYLRSDKENLQFILNKCKLKILFLGQSKYYKL